MSDQPTAAILDFPHQPEDRLRLAMRRLEAALEEQAVALAGFRAALGDLSGAVRGLEGGLAEYQAGLREAGAQVAVAHQAAKALEATADKALARL